MVLTKGSDLLIPCPRLRSANAPPRGFRVTRASNQGDRQANPYRKSDLVELQDSRTGSLSEQVVFGTDPEKSRGRSTAPSALTPPWHRRRDLRRVRRDDQHKLQSRVCVSTNGGSSSVPGGMRLAPPVVTIR